MSLLDLVSQAHNSFTYTVVLLVLTIALTSTWFPIIIAIALLCGVIERKYYNKRLSKEKQGNLAVVVTGCSTGFGFALSKRLSETGIHVFSGVRKETDGENLRKASSNPEFIHPIILDVTNDQQIQEASEKVKKYLQDNNTKLLSLVNNAGYGDYSPIEAISKSRLKKMYDVNVFGLVSTTQAFIPLLREYSPKGIIKGRIINISSGAGRLSFPPMGSYSSTKFAVESLSDALRIEMKAWDIEVILIEPGAFHTEFQEKAYVDPVFDGLGSPLDKATENHYLQLIKRTNEHSTKRKRPPMEKCVKVIEDALFDTRPLARYLAGVDVQLGVPIARNIGQEGIVDWLLARAWFKLK